MSTEKLPLRTVKIVFNERVLILLYQQSYGVIIGQTSTYAYLHADNTAVVSTLHFCTT